MAKTIPLIRAGAMVPLMRWMVAHRRPLEQCLQRADLAYLTFVDPNQPIPVHNAATFLANAARDEGPDIGCRIVTETTIEELAFVGRVVLGARTPLQALERVVTMMPFHSGHETVTLCQSPDRLVVGEGWTIRFDDVTMHTIQQFFAAVMQLICRLTLAREPVLRRIEMLPHPELGFAHLEGWFGVAPIPSRDRSVRIAIDRSVAKRRFFKVGRDRTGGRPPLGLEPLSGVATLSSSAKVVLPLHLTDGVASIGRLAMSAGLSRRTLQRQLAAEGTSFSELLEEVRREIALRQLERDGGSLDDVAAKLGYVRQSTLTRAVRRWTGKTPSSVRRGA